MSLYDSPIHRIREAIKVVTQILSHKNIPVYQRGMDAYVQSDAVTGEIEFVVLPYLPDNASEELIMAVQGFLDHEVGHVLFTDFKLVASHAHDTALIRMWNCWEDPFVERMMRKEFAGCAYNLSNLHKFFIDKMIDRSFKELREAKETHPFAYLSVLFPVITRAWSGVPLFIDYMNDGDKWQFVNRALDLMPADLQERTIKANSTADNIQIAIDVMIAIEKGKSELEGKKDKEKSDDIDFDPSSESGDSVTTDEIDEEFEDEFDKSPTEDEDGESSDESMDEEESEGSDDSDSSPDGEGDADEETDGDTELKDEEEPDYRNGKEGTVFREDETEPEGGEHDASSEKPESTDEVDDSEGSEIGEDPIEGKIPGDDIDESKEEGVDTDDAEYYTEHPELKPLDIESLGDHISDMAADAARKSEYLVYSTEHDLVAPPELPTDEDALLILERFIKNMDNEVASLAANIQTDLKRSFFSMNKAFWQGGLRSGKINPSSLSRLFVGDARVFRKKEEIKTEEYDVTLLIDCSGSMYGSKITCATYAAYAMGTALNAMGLNFEILGFTTREEGRLVDFGRTSSDIEKASSKGVTFSRFAPLNVPIFKDFKEKWTPEVFKRLAVYAKNYGNVLRENADGECVEIAAKRLIRQKSKRKMLIVLSDGAPCCNSKFGYDARDMNRHLKKVVEEIERAGVKVFGIGIESNSVARFYKDYAILDDIKKLPEQIISKLKDVLLR